MLLVAVLLLPSAAAAAAKGSFLVDGALSVPSGTDLTGDLVGFYHGTTGHAVEFGRLTVEADVLDIHVFWLRQLQVEVLPPNYAVAYGNDRDNRTETFHNAVVEVTPDPGQGGYVGLDASAGASTLQMRLPAPTDVLGTNDTAWRWGMDADDKIGQFFPAEERNGRNDTGYEHDVPGAHLLMKVRGDLEAVATGEMKVRGVTLHVRADEGNFTIRTGTFHDSQDRVRNETTQWAILEGEGMRVSFQTSTPFEIALARADLLWQGSAFFKALSGDLTAGDTHYASREDNVRLDGTFQGSLAPISSKGSTRALLEVRGDLVETTLVGAEAARVRFAPGSSPFILLGVALGAVVSASAGGLLLFHRRQRQVTKRGPDTGTGALPLSSPELTTEYYVSLAEQALQFEDHVKALHWITLARETAPTSAHVASTLAYVLGELGHYDEALRAYEEASRLDGSEGEADLNAARLAQTAGEPPEVVERFLLRALERSPEFVVDVEDDPQLQGLVGRPLVRKALRVAWDRWGADETVR